MIRNEFPTVATPLLTRPNSTFAYAPILESFDPDAPVVGSLGTEINWEHLFSDLLPDAIDGINVVFHDSCAIFESMSYRIDGSVATFLNHSDIHDANYDYMRLSYDLFDSEVSPCEVRKERSKIVSIQKSKILTALSSLRLPEVLH